MRSPDSTPASETPEAHSGPLISFSKPALVAAFTEWERRWREEPERFANEVDRLLRWEPRDYGAAAAPYLIALLRGEI